MARPLVAIVGRQNVGKSTLLNRLAGKQVAIVEDLPGTTRDRVMVGISWRGRELVAVDTGGLELRPETAIIQKVKEQVEMALAEADVIIFAVDVLDGVTPLDQEIAARLRKVGKPILLVANKADNPALESRAAEFYELGLGDPLAVSAYHGRGTEEVLDRLISLAPAPPAVAPEAEALVKVAVAGRPNVGKSMLVNALLGEERVIVNEAPGTTRDAIDTPFAFEGKSMLLIDTAGIRRRGRVQVGIERYSVLRALRAIDRADVVLLVLDGSEGITDQDLHVAAYVCEAVKGMVLVVNKWDLVEDKDRLKWERYIRERVKFASFAPIVYTSAKSKQGVGGVMPVVCQVYEERMKRLPTAEVNSIVQRAVAAHGPARRGARQLKILYATQAEVNPPSFVFFVNDPKLVHFSYRRYLENRLREAFGFWGTPLRIIFKARGES